MSFVGRLAGGLVWLWTSACLLPAPPPAPRYFAPSIDDVAAPVEAAAVRVAPVKSPVHLREQIVWRRSDVEFGFYDQRRWTDVPATYVERALVRALGAGAPGGATDGAQVVVVAAELMAFEEVLAPQHEASVALALHVRRGPCTLLRRDVEARRPIDGDDPSAVARATGEALTAVVRAVADDVRAVARDRRRCGAS